MNSLSLAEIDDEIDAIKRKSQDSYDESARRYYERQLAKLAAARADLLQGDLFNSQTKPAALHHEVAAR